MIALILVLCAILLGFVYLHGKNNERYWKKRKVAFYAKNKVTGVFWDFFVKDKSIFENICEVYKEYQNEPAVGIGAFFTPNLCVIHPTNIQQVMATDFNSFYHRGLDINEGDLLADNILFMNGNRWKLMRQSMTPLFTSTKLKSMYYIIDKSAVDFIEHLKHNKNLLKGDAFNTLSSFCCAAIGGAVFGVSTGSIFDSPFLEMAHGAFKPTLKVNLKFAIGNLSNNLFSLLGINLFKDYEPFFITAIKQILRAREKDNIKRHDFADLCVSLQKMGKLVDKDTGIEMIPTDELLAAQAFFYFTAGVEPTASSLFAALVELGKSPEHLEKVHKEIDEMFTEHDNKMSYETVMGMKYLDMVISEAMRIHPPIGFISRMCTKDTVLPVGNIKVEKGTKIISPIFAVHHDARYYPDPEKFDPERFAPENRNNLIDITYMPFGKGNRICVGMRYALLQAKAGLVHVLRNFTVKTIIEDGVMRYSKQPIQVRLDNVDLEFIPRNVTT